MLKDCQYDQRRSFPKWWLQNELKKVLDFLWSNARLFSEFNGVGNKIEQAATEILLSKQLPPLAPFSSKFRNN